MNIAAPYNRDDFMAFLSGHFLPDDFEPCQNEVSIEKSQTLIKNTVKLGFCPSLDLSVYEFRHTGLQDPRVTLSRESFKLIEAHDTASNALAVFYSDSANWRLSLITSDYTIDKTNKQAKRNISNPRRYSYLLGEGCKRHTPESMLIHKENPVKTEKELKDRFAIEVVTKNFYKELSDWYEWAIKSVKFPVGKGEKAHLPAKPNEKENRQHLIRLITRLIFVWFIKQKKLIPDWIFKEDSIKSILRDFNPNSQVSGNFYNAIIQNLFFATLNKPIKERKFTDDTTPRTHYGVNTFYRDCISGTYFNKKTEIIEKFKKVPFLNGGLFECLDSDDERGKDEKIYIDGFSRVKSRSAFIPNILFWGKPENDIHEGIIAILNRYNFTIEENTPQEIEVALDPELLGKVFENLLGTYNPETERTARNESGSFYTPREIISYMVDESLISYLTKHIKELSDDEIRSLFYAETLSDRVLSKSEKIANSLYDIKIIDPAVGSGSFPMAILNQLVAILQRLSANRFKSIYDMKIYLIENCIYGVDKQPIAVQIAKLRFFITLICDQEQNDNPDDNYGIIPLPNLETRFVAADTLIGLSNASHNQLDLNDNQLLKMEKCLWDIRNHKNIRAATREDKLALRKDDKELCSKIEEYLLSKITKADKNKIEEIERKIENLRNEIKKLPENFVDITDNQLFEDPSKPSLFREDINKEKRNMIMREINYLTKEINKENLKEKLMGLEAEIKKMVAWNPYDQNTASPWFDPNWMFGNSEDFDIVIGNPPYIQLSNNHGELADFYSNAGYECFSRSGDIYQLFYERSYKLLKENGYLCFITSNKWMRAAYGEKTRTFFANNASTKILIDFSGQRVFESATVDVNIILVEKCKNKQAALGCVIKENCKNNMTDYIRQHSARLEFPAGDAWVILNPIERRIKEKIEQVGKPLKDWDISINYGIKTGCNEAFIIDKAKRDELIEKDLKSAELIRPILRGRDIGRYKINFSDLYLINVHNGMPGKNIPPIDVKKYPAIKEHLDHFWERLKNRDDKGITPYNLRSCAYMDDFSRQKIIWGEISDKPKFAFDYDGTYYPEATTFILTGEHIEYLFSILNSKISEWFFSTIGTTTGVGTVRWKKFTIEQLLVIPPDSKTIERMRGLIHTLRDGKIQLSDFEEETNLLTNKIYGLDKDEVNFINKHCL
jgi:tRNA1(Val) A37 N6-methylase TrmN6